MICSDLIPIIKSSSEPHCPFCNSKMGTWLGGDDPPEEIQYLCNCINLTVIFSSSPTIPDGEQFPIIDSIRFLTGPLQITFLFEKKKTFIYSYVSLETLIIDALIDFDFKDLNKLNEDLNLYIMFS